ncbi:hypothetical protein PGT21_007511 [Puccinia graminis f. sp. tritici]|uniref:GH18 domain-containing protein n=1 Tax=Puccinia graminis f. sp. tritici TaxID=56615 RepID=A0A5B0QHP2_PUCGR|nr:hypothetical protein PGT21_007511 [Puccinia graminis f. sp. tritici]
MVSQLLKLFIISLPALARSQAQAQPNRLSVSISSSTSSTEAHNNTTSTNVQYTTDLPSGSTLIPDANGGNGGIGVNPNPIVNPPTNSTMPSDTNSGNNHNATAIPKKTGARKLAGYYPVYNAEGQPLSELRYDLYDEISFFAATTNANFTIGTDSLTQNEWDTLAFDFVNSCNNHSVFPSYTVGGWGGSRYFSSLVATAENRTAFANSTITFAKKYGFKGIDFDWECKC